MSNMSSDSSEEDDDEDEEDQIYDEKAKVEKVDTNGNNIKQRLKNLSTMDGTQNKKGAYRQSVESLTGSFNRKNLR